MQHTKSIRIAFVATILAAIALVAITIGSANAQNSNAVRFSPTRFQETIEAGESWSDVIELDNITDAPITYAVTVIDFDGEGSEIGSPRFLLSEALQADNPYTLKKYIDVQDSVTIEAGGSEDIVFTVNLPDDVQPGGHFAGIFFSASAADGADENVALSATAGPLILIDVPGAQTIDLSLGGIVGVNDKSQDIGNFIESSPNAIGLRLANEGTVHLRPFGAIAIYDTFGNEVTSLKVNDLNNNILPGSVRRFDSVLEEGTKLGFGRYKVKAEIFYGEDGNQTLSAEGTIWVVPWRLIAAFTALVLVVLLFGRRVLQSYNQRVVERARGVKVSKKK